MDGFITQTLKALGAEGRAFWGSLAPNGSSNPLTASNGGPPGIRAFTTAYAATGQYTITLPSGLSMPGTPTIVAVAQAADLTNWFDVCAIGAYNATTRQFVLQAHRSGTGREVAAAAGARIHFVFLFNNSTGA